MNSATAISGKLRPGQDTPRFCEPWRGRLIRNRTELLALVLIEVRVIDHADRVHAGEPAEQRAERYPAMPGYAAYTGDPRYCRSCGLKKRAIPADFGICQRLGLQRSCRVCRRAINRRHAEKQRQRRKSA